MDQFAKNKETLPQEVQSYLRAAVRIMTSPSDEDAVVSSRVSNGVIETWGNVLADKESADVTIVCHGHVAACGASSAAPAGPSEPGDAQTRQQNQQCSGIPSKFPNLLVEFS